MTIINLANCYNPPTVLTKQDNQPEVDLVKLSELITEHASCFPKTSEDIKKALSIHVGLESTYALKHLLLSSLSLIQNYLSHDNHCDDSKKIIVYKMVEGIDNCTPGFHDRVAAIELSLTRPSTLDDVLYLLRMSLTESCASQRSIEPNNNENPNTLDVHRHNAFFIAGEALKLGVIPLNPGDAHSKPISEDDKAFLLGLFKTHYSPISIIAHIVATLKNELKLYYDYKGYIALGYDHRDYERFKVFLEKIFDSSLGYSIFIMEAKDDDDFSTIINDINWVHINSILINHLHQRNYLQFDKSDLDFFNHLFDTSIGKKYFEDSLDLMIELNLIQFPELFEHLSINLICIIKSLLFSVLPKTTLANCAGQWLIHQKWTLSVGLEIKEQSIKFWGNFFSLIENREVYLAHFLTLPNEVIGEGLRHYNLFDEDQQKRLIKDPELVLFIIQRGADVVKHFLRIITNLSQNELFKMLSKMLITLLSKITSDDLIYLLEIIATLDEAAQVKLFNQKNGDMSVLTLIVLKRPKVAEALRATINKLSVESQITLLSSKVNKYEYSVLMQIAQYEPAALKSLLALLNNLSYEAQVKLLSYHSLSKDMILHVLVFKDYHIQYVEDLVAEMATFAEQDQERWLLHKDNSGDSVFSLAVKFNDSALIPLFQMLSDLSPITQCKVLQNSNQNISNVAHPSRLQMLMDDMDQKPHRYSLTTQYILGTKVSGNFQKRVATTLLNRIHELSAIDPIECILKSYLQNQINDYKLKACLILDAYLKIGRDNPDHVLRKRCCINALEDRKSALHQALNKRQNIFTYFQPSFKNGVDFIKESLVPTENLWCGKLN